jgi:uncharacterized protein YjbI with pentapeptide repeats
MSVATRPVVFPRTGNVDVDTLAREIEKLFPIGGAMLQNGSVTGPTIPDDSITSGHIANATIQGTDIALATIEGVNIGDATITGDNIAGATITGLHISLATIQSQHIGIAAIIGDNIASGTITSTHIENASIQGADIANATITGANIGSAQITSDHIVNATIQGGDIANATITGANITTATINGTHIESASITSDHLVNATIVGGDIANGTITGTNIANATIDGIHIANAAISSTHIGTAQINSGHIENASITGGDIAALTILAGNIGDAQITAGKISVSSLDAVSANMGTLTAGRVLIGDPTGEKVAIGEDISTSGGLKDGIVGADSSNNITFWLDPATGNLQLKGEILSGSTGLGNIGGTVSSAQIGDDQVTSSELLDNIFASEALVDQFFASGVFHADRIITDTITATQIAALTITAAEIAANTITANKMNISQLSALTADLGTITAGTVTGALIRSASAGARNEFDSTSFRAIDASGVVVAELAGASGLDLMGAASENPDGARKVTWENPDDGSELARIFAAKSNNFHGPGQMLYAEVADTTSWGAISVGVRAFNYMASGNEDAFIGVEALGATNADPVVIARADNGTTQPEAIILMNDGYSDFAYNDRSNLGAANAVQAVGVTSDPVYPGLSGVWADVPDMSVAITTKTGDKVAISFSTHFRLRADVNTYADFKIVRVTSGNTTGIPGNDDQVDTRTAMDNIAPISGGSAAWRAGSIGFTVMDTPAAGTHTYKVQWASGTGNSTDVFIAYRKRRNLIAQVM